MKFVNPKYQFGAHKVDAELDEMWSFVQNKKRQVWLWRAVNHDNGDTIAFVLGDRNDETFEKLLTLLLSIKKLKIHKFYADGNYTYQRYIPESRLVIGKINTQRIERSHLDLRTWLARLVRKGIRFSKNIGIHIAMIGMVINVRFWNRVYTV